MLREAGQTVVFIEHDPSLFDGAAAMLEPVANALKEVARESLVILYTPAADRTFAALAQKADHYIEIVPVEEPESYPHQPYLAAVRPASLPGSGRWRCRDGQDVSQCKAGRQQHGGPVAAARALKKEDQQYGRRLVELAKTHSSEAFVACDDPLEAMVFSALVEILGARTH